jgi:hydrogenase maturation protein HypF
VAEAVAETCAAVRSREGIKKVALSGGVFQNDLLLGLTIDALEKRGFEVYTHRLLPPNDACIALGQAAIALARLKGENKKDEG